MGGRLRLGLQECGNGRDRLGAVEVVGVEHGERPVDLGGGGEDRVGGPPRLRASGGHDDAGRQVLQPLQGDTPAEPRAKTAAGELVERLQQVGPNDEDHLAESGPQRVIHAVVHQRSAARTDGVELLQPAVATAETGREDDELRIHRIDSAPCRSSSPSIMLVGSSQRQPAAC